MGIFASKINKKINNKINNKYNIEVLPIDNLCIICFENVATTYTVCNHIFCNICINKLKNCALCRTCLVN